MRRHSFGIGEYYHIYNSSVQGQKLFLNDHDYARFLFSVIYFQSPERFSNANYNTSQFIQSGRFHVSARKRNAIAKNKTVGLVCFAFMPTHFHVCLEERSDGGISQYMQRVQNAYAKYCNAKYERRGHVFARRFNSVPVQDNRQLLHLSAYIHRNPRTLQGWKGKEHQYRWSSYQDYTQENRWDDLLDRDVILEQFDSPKKYARFLKTSPAKDIEFMR